MTRALSLATILFALGAPGALSAGCSSTRGCKGNTVLLSITLGDTALAATAVQVDAQVDGGDHLNGTFPWRTVGTNTLEIDFPAGYPTGKNITLRVQAMQGAASLAASRLVFAAEPGCTAVPITVGGGDGGAGCDPMQDNKCSDDRKSLLACRADGSGFDPQPCAAGCSATGGTAHCLGLQPSGAVSPSDYANATLNATLAADTTFDTDGGGISGGLTRVAMPGVQGGISFRSLGQPGSTVRVGVFGFAGLTIAAGATIHVIGKSPLALVSSADVRIAGNLDLQGDCSMAPVAGGGAGGRSDVNNGDGLGTRGGRSGGGPADGASGGGGGGGGDTGGNGAAGGGAAGGAGGMLFGDLNGTPFVLIGGSAGGAGGNGASGGVGGNGGGALQVSVNGALTVTGAVSAGGCGGKGGAAQSGGGGGGAGGALLLEAITIHLASTATLATNGGGGGGGDGGSAGGNGAPNGSAGSAGAGVSNGTNGGTGGASGRPAGARGIDVSGTTRNGGGGGGAAGRIALRSLAGTITDDGSTLSPTRADQNGAMQPVTTVTRATFQ